MGAHGDGTSGWASKGISDRYSAGNVWQSEGIDEVWQSADGSNGWPSAGITEGWQPQTLSNSWPSGASTNAWQSYADGNSLLRGNGNGGWKSENLNTKWQSGASSNGWSFASGSLYNRNKIGGNNGWQYGSATNDWQSGSGSSGWKSGGISSSWKSAGSVSGGNGAHAGGTIIKVTKIIVPNNIGSGNSHGSGFATANYGATGWKSGNFNSNIYTFKGV